MALEWLATTREAPFLLGLVLSWSLAAPPGPANALMAQVAAREGFARGWWTGMGAVAGDLVMFTLMALGVLLALEHLPALQALLAAAGALLLARFAYGAWRSARTPAPAAQPVPETHALAGFGRCFVIILTSPFNWAWWVTVGAALLAQLGLAIMAGFFVGLTLWTMAWSALVRAGAMRVRGLVRWIAYGSAVVLGAFALLVAAFAVRSLRALLIA